MKLNRSFTMSPPNSPEGKTNLSEPAAFVLPNYLSTFFPYQHRIIKMRQLRHPRFATLATLFLCHSFLSKTTVVLAVATRPQSNALMVPKPPRQRWWKYNPNVRVLPVTGLSAQFLGPKAWVESVPHLCSEDVQTCKVRQIAWMEQV